MEGFTLEANAPRIIEIPLLGHDQSVEIDCTSLPTDASEICDILTNEQSEKEFWTRFAYEYITRGMSEQAISILTKGLEVLTDDESQAAFNAYLAAIYMQQARLAGRTRGANREEYLNRAQSFLDKISGSHRQWDPALLLQATFGIMKSPKSNSTLDAALHGYDRVLQKSGANVFALMGKALVLYHKKNFRSALKFYQRALVSNPSFQPDPRIGIGLCFWQLDMKEEAHAAWTRAQELNPSNYAIGTYLSLYHYDRAFKNLGTEEFVANYSQALNYTQKAFKACPTNAVAACILAGFTYTKKNLEACIKLANAVVHNAFTPSLSADGYFWMGRAYHQLGKYDEAMKCYQQARSIQDNHLLSYMGIGQIQILQSDYTSAKLTFERISEQAPKCAEALIILGCLNASDPKADPAKPKMLLERAFNILSSSKIPRVVDSDLLITQARLWEKDDASKSLKYLEKALAFIRDAQMVETPELLNNVGVLEYQLFNYGDALKHFEAAKTVMTEGNDGFRVLLTYNIARCKEQLGQLQEAEKMYRDVLQERPEFSDARVRLCLLELANPTDATFKTIRQLMTNDGENLEVRAFFGWYLSKQKRRPAEDPELRHCSQTLRHWHDDTYSLVQLGNAYLRQARELRVASPADKVKRQKLFNKAIQSFDQAIKYDHNNAYAAQGIAITLVHAKQFSKAMLILSKVRETIKDVTTLINIGNCLAELKQYHRAIEIFEQVLDKTGETDGYNVLSSLGRVWLQRGREDKNPAFLRESLKYTQRALAQNPTNTSLQFNTAFVQFQLSELIRTQNENVRTVKDLEYAMEQLDEAIKTFDQLVESKTPPFPPADIQQRSNMAKNTTRRQLERAIQQQKETDALNNARLDEARHRREEEKARRLAEQAALEEAKRKREQELEEERRTMQAEVAEYRRNEQQDENVSPVPSDSEDEKPKKKKQRKRRKTKDETESEHEPEHAETSARKTRRRRGGRRVISEERIEEDEGDEAKTKGKQYKSDPFVVSDMEEDDEEPEASKPSSTEKTEDDNKKEEPGEKVEAQAE
ncbi:RNA polymerase II associated Paf1 complex subunit Tpr1 [Schizosaccharomyces japonicus yFS275]|uniref:RNA polymerase II associated Paf1 complex subunit Tpr1 n=1 Tax=Schizosaccharomyces japonicus (strain yFS275 / FY16936) TaxID=402676 RepID=B6JXJ7_SCHJY|nr:RNA polymerase II associated Paf1 complex subunit Tpr1 [Schizosaccharomyces japonicus yFS275]EEB05141.1 RNA polymerase II associated Paf1 complex subunit Tpr1 [Schizosaccharomyces japonicus yFS275]